MATSAHTMTSTMSAMVPKNFRSRIGMGGRGGKHFLRVKERALGCDFLHRPGAPRLAMT
jgi:hypothetical protein